jgi:predicted short-subunit dehydrogenase-like oxidoreductase (DUF2520 family)
MKKWRVVIIGSGNVSFHLVRSITGAGHKIVQIYNRTLSKAQLEASALKTEATDDLENIIKDADIYIICVKDDAISLLADKIDLNDKLIVHTSGTTSMHLLKSASVNYGIFYPLQSFSKNLNIDFRRIPILIESNNAFLLQELTTFANSISDIVVPMSEEDRVHIHIAGVLVNNFTNHLFNMADQYLKDHKIDFSLLKPLISQTVEKLNYGTPAEMQTGPAMRNDLKTINAHLEMLRNQTSLHDIYDMLSKDILSQYKK